MFEVNSVAGYQLQVTGNRKLATGNLENKHLCLTTYLKEKEELLPEH
jgi:hypothetical protein